MHNDARRRIDDVEIRIRTGLNGLQLRAGRGIECDSDAFRDSESRNGIDDLGSDFRRRIGLASDRTCATQPWGVVGGQTDLWTSLVPLNPGDD